MIPVLLAATTTTIANPAAEAINDLANLDQACGTDPSWACRWVYDLTGSDAWAGAADWLAVGLGQSNYTPPLKADHPAVAPLIRW